MSQPARVLDVDPLHVNPRVLREIDELSIPPSLRSGIGGGTPSKRPWWPSWEPTWPRVLYSVFSSPDSVIGMVTMSVVHVAIVVTVVALVIASLPQYRYPFYGDAPGDTHPVFDIIEFVGVVIFTFDYGMRFLTVWSQSADELGIGGSDDKLFFEEDNDYDELLSYDRVGPTGWRLLLWKYISFVFNIMNVIDLVAILPFYIGLVTTANTQGLVVVRVLRIIRVFRVFKIGRYSELNENILKVLVRSTTLLLNVLFFVVLLIVLLGSVIYFLEGGDYNADLGIFERPALTPRGGAVQSPFVSIFSGMYWMATTASTVGYGDFFPTTIGGRIVSVVAFLSSLALMAFPITIIATFNKMSIMAYHKMATTASTVGYGDFFPTTIGGRIVAVVAFLSSLALMAFPITIIATNFAHYLRELDMSQKLDWKSNGRVDSIVTRKNQLRRVKFLIEETEATVSLLEELRDELQHEFAEYIRHIDDPIRAEREAERPVPTSESNDESVAGEADEEDLRVPEAGHLRRYSISISLEPEAAAAAAAASAVAGAVPNASASQRASASERNGKPANIVKSEKRTSSGDVSSRRREHTRNASIVVTSPKSVTREAKERDSLSEHMSSNQRVTSLSTTGFMSLSTAGVGGLSLTTSSELYDRERHPLNIDSPPSAVSSAAVSSAAERRRTSLSSRKRTRSRVVPKRVATDVNDLRPLSLPSASPVLTPTAGGRSESASPHLWRTLPNSEAADTPRHVRWSHLADTPLSSRQGSLGVPAYRPLPSLPTLSSSIAVDGGPRLPLPVPFEHSESHSNNVPPAPRSARPTRVMAPASNPTTSSSRTLTAALSKIKSQSRPLSTSQSRPLSPSLGKPPDSGLPSLSADISNMSGEMSNLPSISGSVTISTGGPPDIKRSNQSTSVARGDYGNLRASDQEDDESSYDPLGIAGGERFGGAVAGSGGGAFAPDSDSDSDSSDDDRDRDQSRPTLPPPKGDDQSKLSVRTKEEEGGGLKDKRRFSAM